MKILLVGGDERFLSLKDILHKNGFTCENIFLDFQDKIEDLQERIYNFDIVILPIPFVRNGFLNAPFINEKIPYRKLIPLLKRFNGKIFGGFDNVSKESLRKEAINFIDILEDEKFTLVNAIITAEGSIEKLINQSKRSLFESKVCILGYGRVSKALSRRMDPLCEKLLVYNNPSINFAYTRIDNIKSKMLSDFKYDAKNFDIIINTIPSLIIDREVLDSINSSTLILDLASMPGGVDFEYANSKNIQTIHYLGIPAKVSSLSSANAIMDFLKNFLQ